MQSVCIYKNVCLVRKSSRHIVFKCPADYRDFTHIVNDACRREPVQVAGICLLPNSVYLLVSVTENTSLARFVQWVFATHAKRYHAKYDTDGSLWRGRAQSLPVQLSDSILIVQHALLRLPMRRRLVSPQERWPWVTIGGDALPPTVSSIEQHRGQLRYVEHCIDTGAPMGDAEWLTNCGFAPEKLHSPKRRGRPLKVTQIVRTDEHST